MEKYFRILCKFPQKFLKDFNRHYSSETTKLPRFPREFVVANSNKMFIIDKLRPSHRDALVPLMEMSYTQEPNAVSLNFPALRERRDPEFMREMREYCETYADGAINSAESLSCVALDSEEKFAGFALGEVERLPFGVTNMDVKHASGRDIFYTSPFFKNVTRMVNKVNGGIDYSSYLTPARAEIARKRNPPEILLAEMSMIGVRPELRKYGLGAKMFACCYELIKCTGCDLIQTMPLTDFAYRESEKLGFKLVRKMVWPFGGTVLPPVTWHNMLLSL
jgi:ribosomal protein S18 acetylase RimI-like enzyme